MKFQFSADATFEANNIDDAMGQLTQHFASLLGGQIDGEELQITRGFIEVYPLIEDEQPGTQSIEGPTAPRAGFWRRMVDALRR